MPTTEDLDPEVRDSTVYWFVVLEAAREQADYALAAEADRELRRLGVQVRHRQTTRQRKEDAYAQA